MGARVLAVASGDGGVALTRRLGADDVVDGHKDDVATAAREFAPDGLDAALVTTNAKGLDQTLATLRDGGRVAYPNAVKTEPQARSGVRLSSYNGTPSPEARPPEPPDRGWTVRGACSPNVPA